jgi:hypothetical protein
MYANVEVPDVMAGAQGPFLRKGELWEDENANPELPVRRESRANAVTFIL